MNAPEELWQSDQRLNQHGEEGDSREDAGSGDFTPLAKQRQGGHRNEGVRQLTDDDEDGNASVKSFQIPELGLTDAPETLEKNASPAANLDQGHALHDLLDHLYTFVTKTREHGSRGSEEK